MKKKVIVKQIKSTINKSANQKKTIKALGLRKINQEVEHNTTPQILGMIKKVSHLVFVEYK